MSAPNTAAPTNGQRPARRGRKPNTSKNQGVSNSNANTPAAPIPVVYDESSEPTTPQTYRKHKKSTNSHGHNGYQNGYQSTPNSQKPTGHQRVPSQPYSMPSGPSHATPIKSAAYAGPTFHASPAASSLPMPKMFSKSLPETSMQLPPNLVTEESDVTQTDSEEAQQSPSYTPDPKGREPSPLDFLFEAARQARGSSGQPRSPSIRSGNLSPSEESVPLNGSETPTSRPATMFPFELDSTTSRTPPIGPSFATPYKDRMNAYRSGNSSGHASETSLNEDDRVAKSEALKKLLGHSPSPKPTSGSPYSTYSAYSYDNQRPIPHRYYSGPNTPPPTVPTLSSKQRQSSACNLGQGEFPFQDIITQQRPPSSKLRQQVSPNYADTPVLAAAFDPSSPSRTPRAMDTKRIEDDMRRLLKLDSN